MDVHDIICPGSVAKLMAKFESIVRIHDYTMTTGLQLERFDSPYVVLQHRKSIETCSGSGDASGDHKGSTDNRSSRELPSRGQRCPKTRRGSCIVDVTGTEQNSRATGAGRKERDSGDTCGVHGESGDGCFSPRPPSRGQRGPIKDDVESGMQSAAPSSASNSPRKVLFVKVYANGVVCGATTPEAAMTPSNSLDRPDNRCRVKGKLRKSAGAPTTTEARTKQKPTHKLSTVLDEPLP